MRSSRVTPFLLSTLLCGALVATSMSEGRLGMADDLESPVVPAPDQIEPEPPPRLSADLSDEINGFDDCAEDYYYRYGYEYAAQQESSKDDVDTTDGIETEDYSYDSEEFVYDGSPQETDVEDHDSRDYSEWDSEYGHQDYDEFGSKYAEDYQHDYVYEYEEDVTADDEEMADEVVPEISEYNYEEDYVYDYPADDNLLAADNEITEEENEETAVQSRESFGDDSQDNFEYDEEYSYDYEDEYMGEEYDSDTAEDTPSDVEDDIEEIREDGFSYKYDNYNSEYGYEYMEEDMEPVKAAEPAVETEGTESSYDYGNWEDEYTPESDGYTTEYDEYGEYTYQPETEDIQDDRPQSDSQLEESDSWESEYDESAEWESEYDDRANESEIERVEADESDNDSQFEASDSWESEYDESAEWESEYDYSNYVNDEMEADTPAEDDLGVYRGFTDAYPDEEYAYPEPESQDVAQEEPESNCDVDEFGYDRYDAHVDPSEELAQDDYWTEYGYEYSYPETKYGSTSATEEEPGLESRLEGEPGEPTHVMEECPEVDLPCGVELFAWHPNELLSHQDQEILRSLERLCEDPSGVRRATLNDYLEEQGSDAIEFAGRFEDSSGIDVLGLADDLPGTAAFLASFRLLQRGELGIDEAVNVLRHSLANLSLDWIEGVQGITANALEDWDAGIDQSEDESNGWIDMTSTARPLVVAMVSIANRSISGARSTITTVSSQLADMELSTVLRQLSED